MGYWFDVFKSGILVAYISYIFEKLNIRLEKYSTHYKTSLQNDEYITKSIMTLQCAIKHIMQNVKVV